MDLSKLKRRPSHPFETIAVAISFSPRCGYVLKEAKRLSDVFKSNLLLLHVGEKTLSKENELDRLLAAADINERNCRVIWMEGEPVDTILRLCKLNIVDLLVLGALEKENLFKFYIGSIARNISRKAKCSVLMLTQPEQPSPFKKIIVNGVENPKTVHTVNTALYFAEHFKAPEVTIINETEIHGLAMTIAEDSTAPETKEIKKHFSEEDEEKVKQLLKQCETGQIQVTYKTVKGKPGFAISRYAKNKKADLLVINSPDIHLGLLDRILAHDIEYILADLPCNLLIVHSRV